VRSGVLGDVGERRQLDEDREYGSLDKARADRALYGAELRCHPGRRRRTEGGGTKTARRRTENGGGAIAKEAALDSGTRQGHNKMT
jgi:hypothetical protein